MPRRKRPVDVLEVQRRRCATCIFSARWTKEHLATLLDEIRDPRLSGHFKGYRVCHHSDYAVCAEFWARHRDSFDAGQLAQRLGLVRFVDHDTLAGK
jgi:hypothetical protein